jgi:hypothetical protein
VWAQGDDEGDEDMYDEDDSLDALDDAEDEDVYDEPLFKPGQDVQIVSSVIGMLNDRE